MCSHYFQLDVQTEAASEVKLITFYFFFSLTPRAIAFFSTCIAIKI